MSSKLDENLKGALKLQVASSLDVKCGGGVGIELPVHNKGVLQLPSIGQSGYAERFSCCTLWGPIYILDRPQSLGIDAPARVNLCLIAYISTYLVGKVGRYLFLDIPSFFGPHVYAL